MSRERQKGTLTDRLWRRVDKRGPDECWEWQGYMAQTEEAPF